MLKYSAAHLLLSVAAAAWALWQFQPFRIGADGHSWPNILAEWAFVILSWPLVPLAKWALGWQMRQGVDLLMLLVVLALNSLAWGAVLAVSFHWCHVGWHVSRPTAGRWP